MNKTKEAIKGFVSRSGHHDTEVHETIQPGVTHETVKKTQHEEVNPALDREIHHDHYHHTVQPVHDKKVLPEEHLHQTRAVEHREYDERDHSRTKEAVAAQAAKFKDERVVKPTIHSQSEQAVVAGEHHHHHIHETVQPVIQRETVQPTVVHTTVPIHETHHKAAKHHAATALPAISMDEFKSKGGVLGSHGTSKTQEHHYKYEGQPTEGGKIESGARGGIVNATSGHGEEHHRGGLLSANKSTATAGAAGATGVGALAAGRRRRHHKRTDSNSSYSSSDFDDTDNHNMSKHHGIGSGSKNYSTSTTTGNTVGTGSTLGGAAPAASTTGLRHGTAGHGVTSNIPGTGATTGAGAVGSTSTAGGIGSVPRSEAQKGGLHTTNTHGSVDSHGEKKKPSLLNKLNPLTDADGDGKSGFLR